MTNPITHWNPAKWPTRWQSGVWLAVCFMLCAILAAAQSDLPFDKESESLNSGELRIDPASGLVAEGDYIFVRAVCVTCHSSKLILQNRADREGWERMIRWMQETQKLWELGELEDKILDYLAAYYGPKELGERRPALKIAEEDWYYLE